jgi:hypothetical protein
MKGPLKRVRLSRGVARLPLLYTKRLAPLSGIGFLQTGMESGFVPVGAGVVMGWVGTLAVNTVQIRRMTKSRK